MIDFYRDPAAPAQPDQLAGEFAALLDIYGALKPRRILEIGVREGGTLYQWIKHSAPDAHIVAVDIGMGGDWSNRTMPNPSGWVAWAEAHWKTLTPILGDSHDPGITRQVEAFAPYDFIFIDADHSLSGIMCDFLGYAHMARPGGVVALHDVLRNRDDAKIEIWRYWPLIEAAYSTQVLTSTDGQKTRGIGVVYV